jgi:hypothetical protein
MADLILSNPGTTWSGYNNLLFAPKRVGIIIWTLEGTTELSNIDLWLAYQGDGAGATGNFLVTVYDTVTVNGIPIPTGDILTQSSKTFGPGNEISSPVYVMYSFDVDITLSSGKWYAIMLSVSNYDITLPDWGRIHLATRKALTGQFTESAYNVGSYITYQRDTAPGWLLEPQFGIKFFLYGTWRPAGYVPPPDPPDDLSAFPPTRPDGFNPDSNPAGWIQS